MEVKEIALKDIFIESNYRIEYKDMPNLMQTIKSYGLLQPIGVKSTDDNKYRLIWGHRRFKAFEKLGYKTIPAVIFFNEKDEVSEEDYLALQIVENYQKKSTNLVELGRAIKIARKTMSIGEIASKYGLSRNLINNAITEIIRIPIKWQKKITVGDGTNKKGDIPITSAIKISTLRGLKSDQKEKLYNMVSKDESTVPEVVAIGSLMSKGKEFKESLKLIKKYKVINVKLFVDKNMLEEHLERKNLNLIDFIVETINSEIPNFAHKSIDK